MPRIAEFAAKACKACRFTCYPIRVIPLPDNAINVFTDGACLARPRRGGIGFRIVTTGGDGNPQIHDESPPGYPGATNNQMELQAVISALRFLDSPRSPVRPSDSRFRKVIVYTDSQYVANHVGTAIKLWSRNRWTLPSGPPVLNADLWRELIRVMKRLDLPVEVKWVPGKSDPHTKAVDKLAKASARQPTSRPLSTPTVRRKTTDRSTESGSVPMEGQVLDVLIVEGQYLRTQRCSRYRFEVRSEGNHQGCLDWATSDVILRGAHTYTVRFNDDSANPRIVEMLADVSDEYKQLASESAPEMRQ